MAAILNSGGSAPTASPVAVTGTPTALPVQGAPAVSTDIFTQLIAKMLGARAPAQPAPALLPPDLATPAELSTDGLELPGDDRELDTDDTDDEESGALAVAALLPGLTPATPQPATSSAEKGMSTEAISSAFIARRAEVDVSEAAVEELVDEAASAADDAASGEPLPTPAPTISQNTNPSVHVHAMLASHATAAVDAAPEITINTPVGTPAWQDDLGTQLTWMAINGREAASLRLSPEHLGPLEVRISVREGEASIYFGASNPETRSALEQSLPRLRELLASQGLVLADAGVSRDAPRNAFKPSAQPSGPRGISDAAVESNVSSVTLTRMGLVDTYV
jgi:flagellar hook-length control protein FliK